MARDSRASDVLLVTAAWLDEWYPRTIGRLDRLNVTTLLRVTGRETLFGLDRLREVFTRRKLHHAHQALQDISFALAPGEAMAFVGRNGAGKSTLLKIITGIMLPDTGQVRCNGRITGLLEGEDVLRTAGAMRAFGARLEQQGPGRWRVEGNGGFQEPTDVIDCGNAGTAVRLILGAAAGFDMCATFTGDQSLRGRPMNRVLKPLGQMGATWICRAGGRLPLTLKGGNLRKIAYTLPEPSAQVKSAVLLAGLHAAGGAEVIEPSKEAQEAYIRHLRSVAVDNSEYVNECTPSYFNNEGDQQKKRGIFGEPWGHGYYAFTDMLAAWREAGELEGLNLSFEPVSEPAE